MRKDTFVFTDKDGKRHEYVAKSEQDFPYAFGAYKAGIKKK